MADSNSTSSFYVYLHRRATDGRVFYVGKGKSKRYASLKSRTAFWKNIVAKHGYTVEFVQRDIQEWYAFELEKELIAYYGRENLCNLTDGGEGVSGVKWSEESRKKQSLNHSGEKNFWFGKTQHPNLAAACRIREIRFDSTGTVMSDIQKKKISKSLMGHKVSQETRDKIFLAKKKKAVICSNGLNFSSISKATEWLRNSGFIYAQGAKISKCCKDASKTAYGYKWSFKNADC